MVEPWIFEGLCSSSCKNIAFAIAIAIGRVIPEKIIDAIAFAAGQQKGRKACHRFSGGGRHAPTLSLPKFAFILIH